MFDRDGNGTINFHEFSALWKYITDWQHTFRSYDKDNSGSIDKRELQTGIMVFYVLPRTTRKGSEIRCLKTVQGLLRMTAPVVFKHLISEMFPFGKNAIRTNFLE